jgi:transcriptional regulator with XRE-family HTH domain
MKPVTNKAMLNKGECSKIDAHVGGQVRRRRFLAGITQEDVGKVLGVSFQQIQKYENGANRISAGRLYVLASLFNVSVNDFFAGLDPICQADHPVDNELRRVEKFAASREGMNLNLAYLDAPNARVRKLVIEVLQLSAGCSGKSGAVSHNTRN